MPLYPIIKYTLGFLSPVALLAFVTFDYGRSAPCNSDTLC
jgi:hypothetical protein